VAVVIEDDVDARELTQLVLTQSGFTVHTAADGPSGIEAVRRYEPILTTLDVQMPGMDGFAVAKQLRAFSLTYLIMITSMDSEIDLIQGFEAGADDYLVKPFRPRELRARADSMLRRPRDRAGVPDSAPVELSWAAQLAQEITEHPLMPLPTDTSLGKRAAPVPVDSPPAPPVRAPQPGPYSPAPTVVEEPYAAPRPLHEPADAPAAPAPQPTPQAAPRPAVPTLAEPAVATAPTDPIPGGVLTLGDITLDSTTGRATYQGQLLDLTSAEFDLLSTLMRTGRRVRSKADLVLALRGHSTSTHFVNEADTRTVDHHVAALKLKLRDEGRLIETVRGVGYRLAG